MPRNSKSSPSATLLEAALEGLQLQRSRIDQQIAEVKRWLGQRSPAGAHGGGPRNETAAGSRGRRPLSAAARKRIAAAQKRRWAEYRKQGGAAEARGRKAPALKKSGAAKKGAVA